MKILLVEDEKGIAEPIKKALERRTYAVEWFEDGKEAYDNALVNDYDCILLDLNLPSKDGIKIAKDLRKNNIAVPILMLTARSMQDEINEGLLSGADDYLTKPFDFKELLLRIQNLLKRNNSKVNNIQTIANLKIDLFSTKVFLNNDEVDLNTKEFGILEYLIRNKGRVISQEELLEHVWNSEIDSFTQTVRTNIKTLRKKVDPEKSLIKTKKGRGYYID